VTAPEAAELAPLCRWLAERTAGPLVERILLTGSRTWTRGRLLRMALELLPPTAQLVHGYARGADSLADQIWGGWLNRRVEQHPLPEGWYRVNRRAGLDRNQHMVSLGADLCLAFIRGGSGGATHCAESARAAGIPTFVFRQE
jgi:hypothetical protein